MILFGTLITKTIGYQQVFSFSHLTYLVQLLYLGELSRPKYHEFSFKLLIFPVLQYWDIKCKTVPILFYLLIIWLTVYNRTIARFITDDKVVYQRMRQATRLALDSSWARRRLKHLSCRSRWIILCTLERGMPCSRKISKSLYRQRRGHVFLEHSVEILITVVCMCNCC